jgi:hypothetical protein
MRLAREADQFSQIGLIEFGRLGFNLPMSKSNFNFILGLKHLISSINVTFLKYNLHGTTIVTMYSIAHPARLYLSLPRFATQTLGGDNAIANSNQMTCWFEWTCIELYNRFYDTLHKFASRVVGPVLPPASHRACIRQVRAVKAPKYSSPSLPSHPGRPSSPASASHTPRSAV